MKKLKKIFSLMLVAAMCFGIAVPAAFAEGEQVVDVLTIGNSVTTGFGLDDYVSGGFLDGASEKSLPYLFCDYLSEKLGGGVKVNNVNLSMEGMRFDELRGILDPTYDPSYKAGGKGDSYFALHKITMTNTFNRYKAKHGAPDITTLYRDAVADAEIIILDLASCELGNATADRISDLVAGIPTETLDDISDELDFDILPVRNAVNALISKYFPEGLGIDPELVSDIAELLVYAQCNVLANLTRDMELIRELNSDAKVIVVGSFGIQSELIAKLGAVEVDAAALWQANCAISDTLLTSVCRYKDDYIFAAMPDGLETFVCGAAKGEPYPRFESVETQGIMNSLKSAGYAGSYDAETIKNSFYKASRYRYIDLMSLINSRGAAPDLTAFVDWDNADDSQKASAKLFVSFNGASNYAFHPDEKGCMQKFIAVRDAYESAQSAGDRSNDAVSGLTGSIGKVLLSVIKAPLINTLVSVLDRIGNTLRDIFVSIFSFPYC